MPQIFKPSATVLARFSLWGAALIVTGVGCSTCHGKVDEMPLMWQSATLQMQWCLDCHRKPEPILRERDKIVDMTWTPPADQAVRGKKLAELYHVATPEHLTSCYVCHR